MFPSPIGELHFSIWACNIIDIWTIYVSVPYRGATFLNPVPAAAPNNFVISFPSPIGELHFSIQIPELMVY